MKKKICIVTGTRAEYHLLYPLLKAISQEAVLELLLAVTGAHLSKKFGETYKDIEKDGFEISVKIPILQDEDGANEINMAMSNALLGFSDFYGKTHPDMVEIGRAHV